MDASNPQISGKEPIKLTELPDLAIQRIVKHMDSRSLCRMFRMSRAFHRCILGNLSELQPMYAYDVTIQTGDYQTMAASIDPIKAIEEQKQLGNLPAHFDSASKEVRQAQYLINAAYEVIFNCKYGMMMDLYGVKLKFEYFKNHHDTFLFMHPNCIEFSKQWPDSWKTSPEFVGIGELMTPEYDVHCMFREEKVFVTHHGPVSRTILVFTPDSIRSFGARMVRYLNQDKVDRINYKNCCIFYDHMDWLLKVKAKVGRLTFRETPIMVRDDEFFDLINLWKPTTLAFDFCRLQTDFFKGPFWSFPSIKSAKSLSFTIEDIEDVQRRPYVLNCATHNIDFAAMNFETLKMHTDLSSTSTVNGMLKRWVEGKRVLKNVVLKRYAQDRITPVFEEDKVLEGIPFTKYRTQHVIRNVNDEELYLKIGIQLQIQNHRF